MILGYMRACSKTNVPLKSVSIGVWASTKMEPTSIYNCCRSTEGSVWKCCILKYHEWSSCSSPFQWPVKGLPNFISPNHFGELEFEIPLSLGWFESKHCRKIYAFTRHKNTKPRFPTIKCGLASCWACPSPPRGRNPGDHSMIWRCLEVPACWKTSMSKRCEGLEWDPNFKVFLQWWGSLVAHWTTKRVLCKLTET